MRFAGSALLRSEREELAESHRLRAWQDELSVLEDGFDFIIRDAASNERNRQFLRVLELRNLPDFSVAAAANAIDYTKFRKIRESDECIQFRHFLEDAAGVDDRELMERVESVGVRLGNAVSGPRGQVLRLAGSTLLGMPGIVASVAAGAGNFLIDRFIKRNATAAFLDDSLPSIFKLR
jgi:hypothetical protein